jgi:flagellar hook-basal body complex protein FliE
MRTSSCSALSIKKPAIVHPSTQSQANWHGNGTSWQLNCIKTLINELNRQYNDDWGSIMQISANSGANSLLQEMQSLQGEIRPSFGFQPGLTQQINNTSGADFGQLLAQAVGNVNQLQSTSAGLATRLEMGDSTVTLSDTVIAREKASVAFEATVQVRNKLVEAYKEIMSMPV